MRSDSEVVLGDRYTLNHRIAVGGMGEVWEATDTLLGRRVAVKILKEEFRTAPTFLARFRAEARHAGQLNHPGIAAVYDYGEAADSAFLVMELVDGQPLSELIVEQPGLSDLAKLSILVQAADALHAAHEAGIVHRDVKPGNLMVRPDGTVKVTDFGIARALASASLTDHGQMIGTPAYVSPEQASGDPVTGASDIYSLGVVAYEMFAGHWPFERDTPLATALAHVHDAPPPLPDTVPKPVADLIESALAKDPSQRPPSVAQFAAQLRGAMASLQSASTAPTRTIPLLREGAMTPTLVSPAVNSHQPVTYPPLLRTMANQRNARRNSSLAVMVFASLLILIGGTVLMARWLSEDSPSDLAGVPSPIPSASPNATEPLSTEAPPADTLATEPLATEPLATEPPPTDPPPTEPAPTQPATAEPPSGVVTPAGLPAGDRIAEDEGVAFVLDYYEGVAAGRYEITWALLSPEFREARNLTFERYVSYWEQTTIEITDVRFVGETDDDQGRVRFRARYDTGERVAEETDEVTLRRIADGGLIIVEQRTV